MGQPQPLRFIFRSFQQQIYKFFVDFSWIEEKTDLVTFWATIGELRILSIWSHWKVNLQRIHEMSHFGDNVLKMVSDCVLFFQKSFLLFFWNGDNDFW